MKFEPIASERYTSALGGRIIVNPRWASTDPKCTIRSRFGQVEVLVPAHPPDRVGAFRFYIRVESGMEGFVISALLAAFKAADDTAAAVLNAAHVYMNDLCPDEHDSRGAGVRRGRASKEDIRRYMKAHGV